MPEIKQGQYGLIVSVDPAGEPSFALHHLVDGCLWRVQWPGQGDLFMINYEAAAHTLEHGTRLSTVARGSWLIWSHEHGAWWRPRSLGYTTRVVEAGWYTEEAAREICKDAAVRWRDGPPPEVMIPANCADLDQAVQKATAEAMAARKAQP